MTEFVDVPGGRIAFEVTGGGPLVVLSHGIGRPPAGLPVPGPGAGPGRKVCCGPCPKVTLTW
jgi:hypothetical protein